MMQKKPFNEFKYQETSLDPRSGVSDKEETMLHHTLNTPNDSDQDYYIV